MAFHLFESYFDQSICYANRKAVHAGGIRRTELPSMFDLIMITESIK